MEDKDDGAEQLEAAHERLSWLGLSDWVDLDAFATVASRGRATCAQDSFVMFVN